MAFYLTVCGQRLVFEVGYSTGSTRSSMTEYSLWTSSILCGVLQGSVHGPLLFILYAADVIVIAPHRGLHVHFYADHTQLYFRDTAVSCERQLLRLIEYIFRNWELIDHKPTTRPTSSGLVLSNNWPRFNASPSAMNGVYIPVSTKVDFLGSG